jgi:hypothetical protein
MDVPKTPNALVRAVPSKVCARTALPPVAAAPTPAIARAAMSTPMSGANVATIIAAQQSATPPANIRRRPVRSASEPLIAMKLANVRKGLAGDPGRCGRVVGGTQRRAWRPVCSTRCA